MKTLSSKTVFETKRWKIKEEGIVTSKGRKGTYFVREMMDWGAVFALKGNKVVLIREYRQGPKKRVLQFPQGLFDKGGSAREQAKREFEEETGFELAKIKKVAVLQPNPAFQREKAHLFFGIAGEKLKEGQALDSTEEITVELHSPKKVFEMPSSGKMVSMHDIAIVHLVKEKVFGGTNSPEKAGEWIMRKGKTGI